MNNDEVNALLDAAKPGIIKSLQDELTKTISWDAKSKIINTINAYIEEWVKKEILPELANELATQKDGMLLLGNQMGPKLVEIVTASMTVELETRLSDSYKRTKFFENLFGRGY
jgi:hypothetical protein